MSKKNRAALRRSLLTLSMVLVVAFAAVGGTLAWLTAGTEVVTNTFTLGEVKINLDESKVTEYGVVDGTERVKANSYKLLPGQTYAKEPKVHVLEGSEPCYLFVKIDNQLSDIEATENTIIAQMTNDYNWKPVPDETNVYYYDGIVKAGESKQVFASFTLQDLLTNDQIKDADGKTIVIDAFAVQATNVDDAPTAWTQGFTNWN